MKLLGFLSSLFLIFSFSGFANAKGIDYSCVFGSKFYVNLSTRKVAKIVTADTEKTLKVLSGNAIGSASAVGEVVRFTSIYGLEEGASIVIKASSGNDIGQALVSRFTYNSEEVAGICILNP